FIVAIRARVTGGTIALQRISSDSIVLALISSRVRAHGIPQNNQSPSSALPGEHRFHSHSVSGEGFGWMRLMVAQRLCHRKAGSERENKDQCANDFHTILSLPQRLLFRSEI